MMGFLLFLVVACVLWFILTTVQSARKKKTFTIPQPNELTAQFSGVSTVETIEQTPRYTPTVSNSHWHRHTFERPRRKKVKK